MSVSLCPNSSYNNYFVFSKYSNILTDPEGVKSPCVVLDDLSWDISPIWESLGRRLGVQEPTIANISGSVKNDTPTKKAFAMLKARYDKRVCSTPEKLFEALEHLEQHRLVEKYHSTVNQNL